MLDTGLLHLEKCFNTHSPGGVVGAGVGGGSTKAKKKRKILQKANVKIVHLVRSLQLIIQITANTIMKEINTHMQIFKQELIFRKPNGNLFIPCSMRVLSVLQ